MLNGRSTFGLLTVIIPPTFTGSNAFPLKEMKDNSFSLCVRIHSEVDTNTMRFGSWNYTDLSFLSSKVTAFLVHLIFYTLKSYYTNLHSSHDSIHLRFTC